MRFLRHKMYWLTVHQVLMVLTIVIAAVGALGSLAGSGDVRCLCGVFRAWLCRMSELHVACHAAGAHHHARHHGVGAGERGRVVGSPGLRGQVLPQQALPPYSIRVRGVHGRSERILVLTRLHVFASCLCLHTWLCFWDMYSIRSLPQAIPPYSQSAGLLCSLAGLRLLVHWSWYDSSSRFRHHRVRRLL